MRHSFAIAATLFVGLGCSGHAGSDFDDEKAATTVAALDTGTTSVETDDLTRAEPKQAALDLTTLRTKGCRTRTVDPADPQLVHIVLDGCTGRFGKHVMSGRIDVRFSSNADGSLHAESTSDGLTIDGRAATRTATADIVITDTQRRITRHSEKTGTKKNGDTLTQTTDHVIVVDRATRCRTVDGTGLALVGGGRRIETSIVAFQTCETEAGEELCPTGTIDHVNQTKGKTVHATFDGSSTATLEISKPKRETTESWALDCAPR